MFLQLNLVPDYCAAVVSQCVLWSNTGNFASINTRMLEICWSASSDFALISGPGPVISLVPVCQVFPHAAHDVIELLVEVYSGMERVL